MPGKGKRVAARQAQLNRRRRRQARSASEGGVQTAVEEGGAVATSIASRATAATTAASTSAAPSADAGPVNSQPAPAAVRPIGTPSAQGRNMQPMAYTHLAGELRRILILAGIVTAVLIGVSFAV